MRWTLTSCLSHCGGNCGQDSGASCLYHCGGLCMETLFLVFTTLADDGVGTCGSCLNHCVELWMLFFLVFTTVADVLVLVDHV